jgi:hypothetical protein
LARKVLTSTLQTGIVFSTRWLRLV